MRAAVASSQKAADGFGFGRLGIGRGSYFFAGRTGFGGSQKVTKEGSH